MDPDAYVQSVFLSLPPMERTDLNSALSNLEALYPSTDKDALLAARDTRTCMEAGATGSSQMEHIRARLQEQRDKLYNEKGRTHRMSIHEATREEDDKQTIHIQTYAEHLDAANLRSGYWSATWDIVLLTQRECEIIGTVQIHSHYAEKTNVHMQVTRQFDRQPLSTEEEKVHSMVAVFEKGEMSYEEQLSKIITSTIVEYEKELYDELQRLCDEVDDSMKRVRRVSPRSQLGAVIE
jgi:hypothetical protein